MHLVSLPIGVTALFISGAILVGIPQPLPAQTAEPMEQSFSSVEERRLQTRIAQEREAILQEKKELELRENELKTLEAAVDKKLAEIDAKIAELQKHKDDLETVLDRKNVEEQKKILELSKIYDRMAPDKAALALSGLEQRLAAEILANMKVKAAAGVLDSLNKQKAVELSEAFSTIQIE